MTSEGQCNPGGSFCVAGIPTPRTPIQRDGRDAWSLAESRAPRPHVPNRGASTAQIRAWGNDNGFAVQPRGAIPQRVREAYDAAVKTGERA